MNERHNRADNTTTTILYSASGLAPAFIGDQSTSMTAKLHSDLHTEKHTCMYTCTMGASLLSACVLDSTSVASLWSIWEQSCCRTHGRGKGGRRQGDKATNHSLSHFLSFVTINNWNNFLLIKILVKFLPTKFPINKTPHFTHGTHIPTCLAIHTETKHVEIYNVCMHILYASNI